jgi:hypothetical protein
LNSVEFLEQIKRITKEIKRQSEKVQDCYFACLPASGGASERVQASKNVHSLEDKIVKYDHEKEKLERLKFKRIELKHTIMNELEKLDDWLQFEVMYGLYIELFNMIEVSKRVDMDHKYLYKVKKNALKRFEEIYKGEGVKA